MEPVTSNTKMIISIEKIYWKKNTSLIRKLTIFICNSKRNSLKVTGIPGVEREK